LARARSITEGGASKVNQEKWEKGKNLKKSKVGIGRRPRAPGKEWKESPWGGTAGRTAKSSTEEGKSQNVPMF